MLSIGSSSTLGFSFLGPYNSIPCPGNGTNSMDSDCGHSAHEKGIELALVEAANKFRDLKL
jgi:hypothetical protein